MLSGIGAGDPGMVPRSTRKRIEWKSMGKSRPGERIPVGARRHALRIGAPITALAMIAAGTTQAAQAAAGSAAAHTPTVVGTVAKAPAGATATAAPSDSTETTVSVLLTPRDAAGLQQYADAVSNPHSALYKHYLSSQQVAAAFAPSQASVQAVEAALRKVGLTPGAVGGDNLDIEVHATLGQLKSAFGIGFAGYRLANGHTAFGATSAPKLDGTVAPLVEGVLGLDDFAQHHPDDASVYGTAVPGRTGASATKQITSNASAPQMCSALYDDLSNFHTSSGTTLHLVDGKDYYSPASLDTVYGLNTQLSAGNTGSGQTVAVVEWEAVSTDAIATYFNCYGLNNQVTYTKVDNGPYTQPTSSNGVGVESVLDIETIASLAPGAKIIDYMGPDGTGPSGPVTFTDADWLDTMMAPVTADQAKVISMSWSQGCEAAADTDTTLTSGENTVFQMAAAQGQTFVNSSGDQGSTECSTWTTPDSRVSPSDPANNPYVTGVGGTKDQGISSVSTTTWNESALQGGASGGGVSAFIAMPSGAANYQSGFTGAGYQNACKASGTTCRQSPDISALADPYSGFPIISYATSTTVAANGWYYGVEGGTSWAAPIVAAIAALTDNTSACKSSGSLGLLNPALYGLAKGSSSYSADFTDVTTGSNAYTPDNASNTLYQAGTGYDMATGLGVLKPAGWAALCGALTPSSTVYALTANNASVQEWNGSSWTTIGGAASALYAGTAGVFAANPAGTAIFKYSGVANQWTQVGGAGAEFAVSGDSLYALTPNHGAVMRYNGSGTSWTQVGGAAQNIYAAASGVFATSPGNKAIYKYSTSGHWAQVGGAGSQFATSGSKLFGLGPNGSYVAEWTGSGTSWTIIGGSAGKLYAGGLGLFATNAADTAIYSYTGDSNLWHQVGGGGADFAVSQTKLYGQSVAGGAVYEYSGTPESWTNIGGTPATIVGG